MNMTDSYRTLDLVGDGGDGVLSYLVEWAVRPFASITPTVQQVNVTTTSNSSSTAFSLLLLAPGAVSATNTSTSAFISVSASATELQRTLENMPNVAEVKVSKSVYGTVASYLITFVEALNVPTFAAGPTSTDFASTSSLSITTVQQASFIGSSYAFARVAAAPGTYAQNYLIRDLIPGFTYYARVSAGNSLGYGSRRLTAPAQLAVPVTQPTLPTQSDGPWASPRVHATGPSSALIQIGPPEFGMYIANLVSADCFYFII
jgi:hypothetical protein